MCVHIGWGEWIGRGNMTCSGEIRRFDGKREAMRGMMSMGKE